MQCIVYAGHVDLSSQNLACSAPFAIRGYAKDHIDHQQKESRTSNDLKINYSRNSFCSQCSIIHPKSTGYCPVCNHRVRTRPKTGSHEEDIKRIES